MTKFKILTVIGARPQFIKAAMLSSALQKEKYSKLFSEIIVHTGQHYDQNMSDVFFNEFNIPRPQYTLNINNLSHGKMTGEMIGGIEDILHKETPNVVLVYGDTNSTLSGALAAAKLDIPVIHIEAGLRSFNKKMPEEINRVLTDHVSTLLFCPTNESVINLKNENIKDNVFISGDIMHDLLAYTRKRNNKDNIDGFLRNKSVNKGSYILLTMHRSETINNVFKLKQLLDYVVTYARKMKLDILFPIHPGTKNICQANDIDLSKINVIEPQGYFDMQSLLQYSAYAFTDSGGLQKEAYYHRVPCVTLRDETEWVETISSGWNRLWNNNKYMPRTDIAEYTPGHNVSEFILEKIKQVLMK